MKKRIIAFLSVLALAVLLCFVVACTPQTPKQTVSFETNGGTEIQSVKVDKGNCIDEPTQPTREGYTFDGWYEDEGLTNEFNFSTPIDEDFTLYVKWKLTEYTITYNLNGGTNSVENPASYNINTSFALRNPTREGYEFKGWYGNSNFVGDKITEIKDWQVGGRQIYALWTLIEYPIKYNLNGGTNPASSPTSYNVTDRVTLKSPTREGYTFDGWYEYSDFAGEKVVAYAPGKTGEINLYAKWSLKEYTIHYVLNGGVNSEDNPDTYNILTGATLKSPTREGYEFDGWYETYNFKGEKVTEIPVGETGTVRYYAKWKPGSYVITYNANGGVCSKAEDTVVYGSEFSLATIVEPVKGYYFSGWYDIEGNEHTAGVWDETNNIELIAQWTPELKYTLSSDELYYTVTGRNIQKDNYSIFAEYQEKPVKAIGDSAFEYCKSLTSIEIPDSVTSIGEIAFENCSSLTSIEIPNSVTSIGSGAFRDCDNLTSIEIPNSVTSIGSGAFRDCDNLTSIEIPDSVRSIGNYAFYNCHKLTIFCEIANKPSGWSSDWNSSSRPVVWNCRNNNVADDGYIYTTINGLKYAIKDNEAKVARTNASGDIVIPSSIVYNTTTYTVTSIGSEAFSGCSNLTSVILPNSITIIGEYAFFGCSNLISVIIPNSVTSIGKYISSNCNKLTIYCEAISKPSGWNSNWNSNRPVVWDCRNNNVADDGYIYGITVEGINYAVKGNEARVLITNASGDIVIPNSIAFNDQTYSVTGIGDYAFRNCSSLTSIEIPDSVTSIGYGAFYNCSNILSITIPSCVTSIGNDAFYNCRKLIIYCEASCQPSDWAGNWNSSDRPIVWDGKNNSKANDGYRYAIINGINYAIANNTAMVAGVDVSRRYIIIPTSIVYNTKTYTVTSIRRDAFFNCSNLTSIEIPDSVTSIGSYAFYDCSNLTSIEIPDSVTHIWDYTFYGCNSLKSIEIPDSVTSIGYYAFKYCSSLTSIEIPDSVTGISYNAFEDCNMLTIYCEAKSKPSGWVSGWNPSNCPVVWGCKVE